MLLISNRVATAGFDDEDEGLPDSTFIGGYGSSATHIVAAKYLNVRIDCLGNHLIGSPISSLGRAQINKNIRAFMTMMIP